MHDTSGIIIELQAQGKVEVSRGEAAIGAPVGIPVAANPIEVQHQQQKSAHLKVGKAHEAQLQQKKNL